MSKLLLFLAVFFVSISYAEVLNDPTEPPNMKADSALQGSAQNGLVLYVTYISGKKRSALINATLVKEGDIIFGYKVVKIGLQQVTLLGDEGELILKLVNVDMIKPVKKG